MDIAKQPARLDNGSIAMTITTSSLTRAAGAAAVAAGAIFIGVQIGHPQLDLTSITTTNVFVRDCFKVLMCALAVAGLTGMYLSQVRRNGLLGLIGYLVFTAGYLSGVVDGLVVADRLRRGNVLGAFCVSTRGDWQGLPSRGELTLLDDHEPGGALR